MNAHRGLANALAWCCATLALAAPVVAGGPVDRERHLREFLGAHSGRCLHWSGDRLTRVFGDRFAEGDDAAGSAAAFLATHAGLFGVRPEELVAASATDRPGHVVPLMHDPDTGGHRFTSLHYRQVHGGLPVFRASLTLLVRNEPGFPLVLASADLRDLADAAPAAPDQMPDEGWVKRHAPGAADGTLSEPALVIWAGVDGQPQTPRVAVRVEVDRGGEDRWLYLLDADDGSVLFREHRILYEQWTGTVSGVGNDELGADICTGGAVYPLPYARVSIGEDIAYTDADGVYTLQADAQGPALVQSMLWGQHFRVFNDAGVDALLSQLAAPGEVHFLHNAADEFEFDRSQVNAYVHANVVRDFVLGVNPQYPSVGEEAEFPVNVNLNANCNAFYTPGNPSINFFTSGGDCPNTAFDTVVYHEYGHHLVNVGGSGQGAYGEGMSDTVAVLITDVSGVGRGWRSDCELFLRDADNDCQYSAEECTTNCGSEVHACGRLLSGAVWSMRNELARVKPAEYRQLLAALTLNSIPLHKGSGIDAGIAVDFLTLDDDNDTIFDGTPHYEQIAAGFAAHGLDAPALGPLDFSFPDGLPELLSPGGDQTVRVEIGPLLGEPEPGSGTLHVNASGPGGPFVELPMAQIGPGLYEATFPPLDCGAEVRYFFAAESLEGETATYPAGAPDDALLAIAATGFTDTFLDDFEQDLGWSVQSDAGLTTGAWERGVPAGAGDRGDPTEDADGSGQCFATGIAGGNNDVDGGWTALTSPPLDAGPGHPYVTYWRWYSNADGNAPFQDTLLVEISGDGGVTWSELETVGPGGPEVSGGWIERRTRAADVLDDIQDLRLRFTAEDAEPGSMVEAAVDGVLVRSYTCEPAACPGDADGDGTVSVEDLVIVILAWGTADPQADLNGSGLVDVEDLVLVVLNWGGC